MRFEHASALVIIVTEEENPAVRTNYWSYDHSVSAALVVLSSWMYSVKASIFPVGEDNSWKAPVCDNYHGFCFSEGLKIDCSVNSVNFYNWSLTCVLKTLVSLSLRHLQKASELEFLSI